MVKMVNVGKYTIHASYGVEILNMMVLLFILVCLKACISSRILRSIIQILGLDASDSRVASHHGSETQELDNNH